MQTEININIKVDSIAEAIAVAGELSKSYEVCGLNMYTSHSAAEPVAEPAPKKKKKTTKKTTAKTEPEAPAAEAEQPTGEAAPAYTYEDVVAMVGKVKALPLDKQPAFAKAFKTEVLDPKGVASVSSLAEADPTVAAQIGQELADRLKAEGVDV